MAKDDEPPALCVIGGGTAGHAVALAAAALGARCTLIDPRPRLGAGQAADLLESMLFAEAQAHPKGVPFDWPGFGRRLGQALATQAANHSSERLASLGVTIIPAKAVFTDARTVVAAGMTVRARRFVVATGATSRDADRDATYGPGRRLSPTAIVACPALPLAIDIVASVPSGLEWAQALGRLGCAVTLLLEPGATRPFDPEMLAPLLATLRREGVTVCLDATMSPTSRSAPDVMVLGRPAAATAGLDLACAGVALRDGAPIVDRGFRTTNRRIFAIGDVLGTPEPGGGATALQVAAVLRVALFHLPAPFVAMPIPAALRTAPSVAQVGSMETAPADAAGNLRIVRFPLSDTQRGLATGSSGGAKVVVTTRGRIRGAALTGPGAAEAIGAWSLAIAHRVPLGAMAALPVPVDSLAESGRRASLVFVAARLRSALVRRLIGLVGRLP